MPPQPIAQELAAMARRFGADAAARKRELIQSLLAVQDSSMKDAILVHDAVQFLRAHPDDEAVLEGARALREWLRRHMARRPESQRRGAAADAGLPGSVVSYSFSWTTLVHLVRLVPESVELDWDQLDDEGPLADALTLIALPGERAALQDPALSLREWMTLARVPSQVTDLAWLVERFRSAGWPNALAAQTWDALELPIALSLERPGLGASEIELPRERIAYQIEPLSRGPASVSEDIERPYPDLKRLPAAEARRVLDVALLALAVRHLEIVPLEQANVDDVVQVDAGHGFEMILAGVLPEGRLPLEHLFFFLIVKNGVPIGYGPVAAFGGCSELGVNIFEEFRGAEMRFLYATLMRLVRQHLGVLHFFLVPYAMGVGNPDAIATGAFWFYRKLGFVATNPKVEALAREEEAHMARDPSHRSDRAMLKRLSPTSASLDLSGGANPRLDLTKLSLAETRFVVERMRGDRTRAAKSLALRLTRVLGIRDYSRWSASERAALEGLAPLMTQLPDLERWSARERAELARLLREKGGTRESAAARRSGTMRKLLAALENLASGGAR